MAEFMKARVIKSGSVYEVIEYEKPVMYGYAREHEVTARGEAGSNDEGKRSDNLTRSRQAIRQYIWSNVGKYPKFVTFTYKENMQDYEQFKYDWKLFVKRMSRKGIKIRYLYVLEYQQRGAIHIHAVIFNDEYISQDLLAQAWGKGFVSIEKIDHVRNLGAYVCKYLQKESMQEYGSYAYHVSRGLKKPEKSRIDVDDVESIEQLETRLETVWDNVIYDDVTEQFIRYRQLKER